MTHHIRTRRAHDSHTRRFFFTRAASPATLVVLALLAAPLFSGCSRAPEGETRHKQSSATTQTSQAVTDVASPANAAPTPAAVVSERVRAADAALGREIERAINESGFESARWGVSVVSLRDGRVVYARDADELFTPASNMKIYTTAASLEHLGADYRWRTSVYAASEPDQSGAVSGDLVLYGRGAPDFASRTDKNSPVNHLAQLADALYQKGVRRVRGAVVGDESYFRGEPLGDGWLWEDVQWYFGAEVSALSIDDNEITLSLAPASKVGDPVEVKLVPPTDYVRVTNDMETVARGERPTVGVTRSLSSNDVRVWGSFPVGSSPYGVRLSIQRPALRAASLFREALEARGIRVEGGASARDSRARKDERLEPEKSIELAFVLSRPLGEVVRETNKESLNLQAELLLRTLGRERGSLAPVSDAHKMKTRGDDEAGAAVVRLWLREQAGVNVSDLAIHDGSGLSRLDLVTPASATRLLARMAQSPSAEVFRDSLPVGGTDGTLKWRLRDAGNAAARVVAKTGSLTYVNSLSGYATTSEGETLAFSVFCNDETGRASSTRTIDVIATLLTTYPAPRE